MSSIQQMGEKPTTTLDTRRFLNLSLILHAPDQINQRYQHSSSQLHVVAPELMTYQIHNTIPETLLTFRPIVTLAE
jgi:hypothetical protein